MTTKTSTKTSTKSTKASAASTPASTPAQIADNAIAGVSIAPKPASGMDKSKVLFAEVTAAGYDLGDHKSVRQAFIKRSISEIGLTEKGAATYWHNLQNLAKGKKLYSYVAKKKETAPTVVDVNPAPQSEQVTETDTAAA